MQRLFTHHTHTRPYFLPLFQRLLSHRCAGDDRHAFLLQTELRDKQPNFLVRTHDRWVTVRESVGKRVKKGKGVREVLASEPGRESAHQVVIAV
jgi:hypothetical protein